MSKSDLPFGSEFSPAQVDLVWLLEAVNKCAGDWHELEKDIFDKYFKNYSSSLYNRKKLANNTKLSLRAYKLIDDETRPTDTANSLLAHRTNPEKLYSEFAAHILKNLHGLTLVQCVQDIQNSGEKADLIKLRDWLEERGISFPRGGKHPSIMRLWLEKGGVFRGGSWSVNDKKVNELLGISAKELESIASFSPEQKSYLKALANLDGDGPHSSNEIEKLATATYGTRFNEKNLPKQVLYPIEETGFIKLIRGTKKEGRGAKPFLVYRTKKFEVDVLLPIVKQFEAQAHSDIRLLLRKPMKEILDDISALNRHKRGLALEALAFKIMRLVDLRYMFTRLRGSATGGAEVDLLFESSRLMYSRWQIQCKNTSYVSLDDIAKEVGLTHFLKSNVIVIVSTGEIGNEARRYANKVMEDSNLCIILVNKEDIEAIVNSPSSIVDIFSREAEKAMKLKTIEAK